MEELIALKEKLVSIERSTDDLVLAAVREVEDEVISMNVNDQLYNGIDGEGNSIKPPYAESTIRRKIKKNDPYNRVTLKDEGDFYDSFFIDYRLDEFALDAGDQKKVWLERKYGKQIFGLTEENIKKLRDLIREPIIKRFRETIQI